MEDGIHVMLVDADHARRAKSAVTVAGHPRARLLGEADELTVRELETVPGWPDVVVVNETPDEMALRRLRRGAPHVFVVRAHKADDGQIGTLDVDFDLELDPSGLEANQLDSVLLAVDRHRRRTRAAVAHVLQQAVRALDSPVAVSQGLAGTLGLPPGRVDEPARLECVDALGRTASRLSTQLTALNATASSLLDLVRIDTRVDDAGRALRGAAERMATDRPEAPAPIFQHRQPGPMVEAPGNHLDSIFDAVLTHLARTAADAHSTAPIRLTLAEGDDAPLVVIDAVVPTPPATELPHHPLTPLTNQSGRNLGESLFLPAEFLRQVGGSMVASRPEPELLQIAITLRRATEG